MPHHATHFLHNLGRNHFSGQKFREKGPETLSTEVLHRVGEGKGGRLKRAIHMEVFWQTDRKSLHSNGSGKAVEKREEMSVDFGAFTRG